MNTRYYTYITLAALGLLMACSPKKADKTPLIVRNAEAREDSMEMVLALSAQATIPNVVTATVETPPVQALLADDAADDPAIWYNNRDAAKSLVIGTNKKAGLYVYDLQGSELQFFPCGDINNVDVRNGFIYQNREWALVAGSNRTLNTVSLFLIDPETAQLSDTVANIKSGLDEVYGLCMSHDVANGKHYVFVNGKNFGIEQWAIKADGNKLSGELVRTIRTNSQLEGMVADDVAGMLYIGVEQEGIYKTPLAVADTVVTDKLMGSDSANPNIVYDVEGLAIFRHNGTTYLLASSQGNFSYALFRLGANEGYVTSFVVANGAVDGVEETDGLDVLNKPMGPQFPNGLIVLQDGFNFDGETTMPQNFKYVPFEAIVPFLK